MVSVAGLAPARTSLKNWTRELLCIHGLEKGAAENENTRSQARRPALTLWSRFLRGVKDALAAKLARLVSEERSQRRDDGHEFGGNEVFNHSLNVLVGGGGFFVEQVALFANHAAPSGVCASSPTLNRSRMRWRASLRAHLRPAPCASDQAWLSPSPVGFTM